MRSCHVPEDEHGAGGAVRVACPPPPPSTRAMRASSSSSCRAHSLCSAPPRERLCTTPKVPTLPRCLPCAFVLYARLARLHLHSCCAFSFTVWLTCERPCMAPEASSGLNRSRCLPSAASVDLGLLGYLRLGLLIPSGGRPSVVLRLALCVPNDGDGGTGLGFGVVILGKVLDDGAAVHTYPTALADPPTLPYACYASLSFLHPPRCTRSLAHRTYLRWQLTSILCSLTSTLTTCACSVAAPHCALTRAARFIAVPDDLLPPCKGQCFDCNLLAGAAAASSLLSPPPRRDRRGALARYSTA
jgi:hypothetical protein